MFSSAYRQRQMVRPFTGTRLGQTSNPSSSRSSSSSSSSNNTIAQTSPQPNTPLSTTTLDSTTTTTVSQRHSISNNGTNGSEYYDYGTTTIANQTSSQQSSQQSIPSTTNLTPNSTQPNPNTSNQSSLKGYHRSNGHTASYYDNNGYNNNYHSSFLSSSSSSLSSSSSHSSLSSSSLSCRIFDTPTTPIPTLFTMTPSTQSSIIAHHHPLTRRTITSRSIPSTSLSTSRFTTTSKSTSKSISTSISTSKSSISHHTTLNATQISHLTTSLSSPHHKPLLTTPRRYYQREGAGPDPFEPRQFDPYKNESKDYYRYDLDSKYMDPYLTPDAIKHFREMDTVGLGPNQKSFNKLMRQQIKVEANLRRMEDHLHREKVFGAKGQEEIEYFDRDYRHLERRQRQLLDKIYREQVEAVVTEFESDYAPLLAAQLRSEKRRLFWKNIRHRFRFILYPFSLAINSFFLALKFYDHRLKRSTTVTPRLITEAEYQHFRYHVNFNPRKMFKNRHQFYATMKEYSYRASYMLQAHRELLLLRAYGAKTEYLRFKKYSLVNNPVDLYHWVTKRSKYDPAQYALRKKLSENLQDQWRQTRVLKYELHRKEPIMDRRNPTMVLSEEDEKKLGLVLLQKFVVFFRLTAVTYQDQPWLLRKLREVIDMYYDVFIPNVIRFVERFDDKRIENRINKLIKKEVKKQENIQKNYNKLLDRASNPNNRQNIWAGIKKEGSLLRYIKNRLKIWALKRKSATLYDVAAKNRTYFYGAPAGPPFYRVYLQTKHLLKSPFSHQKVSRLTVGQEDAKSFIRKWGDMNNAMAKSPKLRTLMFQAFHDNLTLRSTVYFRISRLFRRKKHIVDYYRDNYFAEVERIFKAIFFKKERYSFQQLYAMSLNEWWYPTQQSIQKFDRFDRRVYDRYDDKDSSLFFSIAMSVLTFVMWTGAYAWAQGRREFFEEKKKDEEKLVYIQEGAEMSHYIDNLLYADKREAILMELQYDGIMKLHDQLCSRMGRMVDHYYSILSDGMRERYELHEPATTLVYSHEELANIANSLKGKERDLETVENFITNKFQSLWCDAAVIFARQSDVSRNPTRYPLEIRQEQADIGHFLMSHIDKIAQSATFPEFEGTQQLSWMIDNGVLKLKPTIDEPGTTHERVMSQDQEERLFRYGEDNPINKFLNLSQAVTYIDHTGDCGAAKLARLENNFELLVQLLDAIQQILVTVDEYEDQKNRTLIIPEAHEILKLYEEGKLDQYLREWHIQHHRYLPDDFRPEEFAMLKAKQLYQDTGNKDVANHFLVYFYKYVDPATWAQFTDDYGDTEAEFGIKLTPLELAIADTDFYERKTLKEHVEDLFRPHINLLTQHINRLAGLRPKIYKQVKDEWMIKFPWVPDLDKEIIDHGWTIGDGRRIWESSQQWARYEATHLTQGTLGELTLDYTVPMMMAAEMRKREFTKGNLAPGTYSRELRSMALKPSEVSDRTGGVLTSMDQFYGGMQRGEILDPEYAKTLRNENFVLAYNRALTWKDEYGITRNPDNWDVIYDQQIWGWDLDKLKKQTKEYLQWMTGAVPTVFDTENVSPTGDENHHLIISPWSDNSYYDAWTDIYTMKARRKDLIDPSRKPKGLTIPYHSYLGIGETELDDPNDQTSLINRIKRIPENYRFKYDSYEQRRYGTDYEFWSNRSLFYERIDRYFHYFKYFLNREWGREILEDHNRWGKIKRWITEGERSESWYEDYFMRHGFRHFLTQDPVYARYGNDFFFRYFIDAPRFDRRPVALYDQHRYDKDGEDIYFDALYNTRALNNPVPLHIEHGYWSLKPWHLFVNSQFAVYRYLIVSDGDYPLEFPQRMQHDLEELERFIVPDIHMGYDAIHSWGRDLFDTTYKKYVEPKDDATPIEPMARPTFLNYEEEYRP